MSDLIWETFDGLFRTLEKQGRRVEELEARVVELERRLQERAADPREVFAARVLNNWPPNVSGQPDFAPLGFTLYDAQGNPKPVLFPGAERRIAVVGVDPGNPSGDEGVRVVIFKPGERERPDAPTRVRVLSVERITKEPSDRAEAEPEEA